jgi:hypothetical protein
VLRRQPIRSISRQFHVSSDALQRHVNNCVKAQLLRAKTELEAQGASDLVARLRAIHAETLQILARAKKSKDWATALRAIARLESQIELEAELLGELERNNQGGVTHVEVVYVDKALIAASPTPALPALLPPADDGGPLR